MSCNREKLADMSAVLSSLWTDRAVVLSANVSAGATSVAVSGLLANATLPAGSQFFFSGTADMQYHMTTADVTASAGGEATLPLFKPVLAALTSGNALILWRDPACTYEGRHKYIRVGAGYRWVAFVTPIVYQKRDEIVVTRRWAWRDVGEHLAQQVQTSFDKYATTAFHAWSSDDEIPSIARTGAEEYTVEANEIIKTLTAWYEVKRDYQASLTENPQWVSSASDP